MIVGGAASLTARGVIGNAVKKPIEVPEMLLYNAHVHVLGVTRLQRLAGPGEKGPNTEIWNACL